MPPFMLVLPGSSSTAPTWWRPWPTATRPLWGSVGPREPGRGHQAARAGREGRQEKLSYGRQHGGSGGDRDGGPWRLGDTFRTNSWEGVRLVSAPAPVRHPSPRPASSVFFSEGLSQFEPRHRSQRGDSTARASHLPPAAGVTERARRRAHGTLKAGSSGGSDRRVTPAEWLTPDSSRRGRLYTTDKIHT